MGQCSDWLIYRVGGFLGLDKEHQTAYLNANTTGMNPAKDRVTWTMGSFTLKAQPMSAVVSWVVWKVIGCFQVISEQGRIVEYFEFYFEGNILLYILVLMFSDKIW